MSIVLWKTKKYRWNFDEFYGDFLYWFKFLKAGLLQLHPLLPTGGICTVVYNFFPFSQSLPFYEHCTTNIVVAQRHSLLIHNAFMQAPVKYDQDEQEYIIWVYWHLAAQAPSWHYFHPLDHKRDDDSKATGSPKRKKFQWL